MRKFCLGLLTIALGLAPTWAGAEPIAFEQAANVTGMGGFEVGAEVDYAYEKIEEQGLGATIEQTLLDIPVFLRVGIPILEAKLTIPYGSVESDIQNVRNENFSGIKDIGLQLKTGLLSLPNFAAALGLATGFPTGDPMKYLGEGLDLFPFAAVDMDLVFLKLHGNIGYEYRGEYAVDVDPATGAVSQGLKVKPGDATHYALGVEIPAGETFSLHAELLGSSYGGVKIGGNPLADSAGSTLSVLPGVRAKAGPLKAKLGVEIPLTRQEDRPALGYAPRSDWRILGGVSLQFSL